MGSSVDDQDFNDQLTANRKTRKKMIASYLSKFEGATKEQQLIALCDLAYFATEEMKELNE